MDRPLLPAPPMPSIHLQVGAALSLLALAAPRAARAHDGHGAHDASPGAAADGAIAPGAALSLEDAIRAAFARNRDVIDARLGVDAAEVERVAAGVLPNPQLGYGVSNFALGGGTFNC